MKNYQKMVCRLVLCVLVLVTAGCGYVSDKPINDVIDKQEMQTCKIDPSKLAEIFKKDQVSQIRCIQENFLQFTKYVKTNSNGSVNESDMNEFIRKFFQDQSETIVKGLSVIFQLNMILLKDEADQISKGNISPLFDLLIEVNRDAILITEILVDMSKKDKSGQFWEQRAKFSAAVSHFASTTLKIISKKTGGQKLNIRTFILESAQKIGSKDIDATTVDSVLFLKKILLAGDREVITSAELEKLIGNLPSILNIFFDMFYISADNFPNDTDHAKFYLDNITELYRIIEFKQENFELLKVDQLTTLIKKLLGPESKINVDKFTPTLLALKVKFLKSQGDSFMLADVKTIIDLVKELNEQILFDNLTYDAYQETLNTPLAITFIAPLKLSEYAIFSKRRLLELQDNFKNLAINFKYFREKESHLQYYGNEYKRPKYGFIELSTIRFAASKLLKSYGHADNTGAMQVSVEEFQLFLLDMKPVLEELKLWTKDFENFARNAVLLADLFQHQSNGDFGVNLNEATEYISMVLSAVQVNQKLGTELSKYCDPGLNKDEPLFDVACVNDNYFKSLLENLNYKEYFPRLVTYIHASSSEELMAYLQGVEGFAREKNDPKIPLNSRESTLILGAMLNIESTFIRFDVNKDNILDNQTIVAYDGKEKLSELDVAFRIYRSAIIKVAKLAPSQEKYAQAIFLYMIKYMEIPPQGSWLDNAKFWLFYKWGMNQPILAKRLNVGTILYYLVNQNATKEKKQNLKLNDKSTSIFGFSL
jgi:hypothetical protein